MTGFSFTAKAAVWSALVFFTGVAGWPILSMFVDAVFVEDGIQTRLAGELFSERRWLLVRNSLGVAAATTAATLLIGAPAAFIAARVRLKARAVFLGGLAIPLIVPPYIFATAWLEFFDSRGIAAQVCSTLLGVDVAARFRGAAGATWVMSWCYFPLVLFAGMAALRASDARQEEAARLHRGWTSAIFGITLRQALPAYLGAGLLVFVLSLGNFGVPSLLGFNVYPLEVFTQFSAFYDAATATVLAMPLVATALGALLLFKLVQSRTASIQSGARTAPNMVDGRWRWLAQLFFVVLVSISTAFPLSALILRAGGPSSYARALQVAWPELLRSILVAAVAASVMAILGLVLAYAAARGRRGFGTAIDMALLSSFAIPGTVLGVGLIHVWNRPPPFDWVYGTAVILVFVAVARFAAIAQQITLAAIVRVDRQFEEAAFVAGVSWPRTLVSVLIPLIWPALAVAWTAGFVLTLGELSASVLVAPAGFQTITMRIFSLMHYGVDDMVAALSVILVLCIAVPGIAAFHLVSRMAGERHA